MRAVEIVNHDVRKRKQHSNTAHLHHEQTEHQATTEVASTAATSSRLVTAPRLETVAEVDDEFPIRTPNRRRKTTTPEAQGDPMTNPSLFPIRPEIIDLTEMAAPRSSQLDFDQIDPQHLAHSVLFDNDSQNGSDSTEFIKAAKATKKPSTSVARFVEGLLRPARSAGSLKEEKSVSSNGSSADSDTSRNKPSSIRKKMSFESIRATSKEYWRSKTYFAAAKSGQSQGQTTASVPSRQAMPSVSEAFAPAFGDGFTYYHPIHTYNAHRDESLQQSFAALPRDGKGAFAGVVESVLEQKIPLPERKVSLGARTKLKTWAQTAKAKVRAEAEAPNADILVESEHRDTPNFAELSRDANDTVSDTIWIGRDSQVVGTPPKWHLGVGIEDAKHTEVWEHAGHDIDDVTPESWQRIATKSVLPKSVHGLPCERNGNLHRKHSRKEYHVGSSTHSHIERKASRARRNRDEASPRHGSLRRNQCQGSNRRSAGRGRGHENKRRGGFLDANAETRLNLALDMARQRLETELALQEEHLRVKRQTRYSKHFNRKRSTSKSSVASGRVSFALRDRSYSLSNYGDDASDAGSWADETDYGATLPQAEDSSGTCSGADDGDENDADGTLYSDESLHGTDERVWLDEAYEEAIRKEAAYSNFCAHHPAHLGGAW